MFPGVAVLIILIKGTVEHGSETSCGFWHGDNGTMREEGPGRWLVIGLVTVTVLQMGMVILARGQTGIMLLNTIEDGGGRLWAWWWFCSETCEGMVMTIGLVTGVDVLFLVSDGLDKADGVCNGLFIVIASVSTRAGTLAVVKEYLPLLEVYIDEKLEGNETGSEDVLDTGCGKRSVTWVLEGWEVGKCLILSSWETTWSLGKSGFEEKSFLDEEIDKEDCLKLGFFEDTATGTDRDAGTLLGIDKGGGKEVSLWILEFGTGTFRQRLIWRM